MGVIYIGDRSVGKTHLAMELAHPKGGYVKVTYPDYEVMKKLRFDENLNDYKATDTASGIHEQSLDIQVQLPMGSKSIVLDWLDTPGEVWRSSWQSENPEEWKRFLGEIQKVQGILLVLPPYREIIKPGSGADPTEFITEKQWCNRFDRWVKFFQRDCSHVRHLLICLNKADLICDLDREASKLEYRPHGSLMNWQQRNDYVFQRYFRPIRSHLKQINRSISGLPIRYFITSIHNRSLLELPWIYLGTFLKQEEF